MRVTLMGIQTSGKGTHGKRLASDFGVAYIEISRVLAARAASPDETGRAIAEHMRKGDLVPDALVSEALALRLAESPDVGFVLDGYPRQGTQVDTLDAMLARLGVDLDLAIHLGLGVDEARTRIKDRLICPTCRVSTSRRVSEENEPCPEPRCNGALTYRVDDRDEDAVERRLAVFSEHTVPIIEAYRESGRLLYIDARGDPDLVYADLVQALRSLPLNRPRSI